MIDVLVARVTGPDGSRLQPARAFIGDRLQVWIVKAGEAVIAVDERVTELESATRRWTVTTASGVWLVEKRGGCGCGSPLKRVTYQQTAEV